MPEDEVEELEDEEGPEEIDDEDLEDLDEADDIADIADIAVVDDDEVVDGGVDKVADPNADVDAASEAKAPVAEDDDDDDEDEEDGDDVEASLDVILKERLVVEEEDDEEEDPAETDERGDSPLKVLPKQPGEFVCQSCFLVKHPSQLADAKLQYCRDCV